MNIADLLHNETEIEVIPHWPVYTISQFKQNWYFFSAHEVTLKKKIQNTNLLQFLNLNNKQNKNQTNHKDVHIFLQVREVDLRQPKEGQLYKIKVRKLTNNQIKFPKIVNPKSLIDMNEWKAGLNCQISLYKINFAKDNKLYSLQWSPHLLRCSAPITSHLRDKLSTYCQQISKKAEIKWLKDQMRIKQFQLIFTFDENQGKIRIVFAHNFVLQQKIQNQTNEQQTIGDPNVKLSKQMFRTNFKIGKDDYQCVELLMEENKQIKQLTQNYNEGVQFDKDFQQKRIQYLKLIKKLQGEGSETVKICCPIDYGGNKQMQPQKNCQEFQCSCCNSFVKLGQFQAKKMITSNRVHQIQIMRQVKMKKKIGLTCQDYELVPVCELCYEQFKLIVEPLNSKENKQTNEKSETKQFKNTEIEVSIKSRETRRSKIASASMQRQTVNEPRHKRAGQYTTKANTTIRQDLDAKVNRIKIISNIPEEQKEPKKRKSSLQLQKKQYLIPYSQNTIGSGKGPRSHKHNSFFIGNQKQISLLQPISFNIKQENLDKYNNIERETDDQLNTAIQQYQQKQKTNNLIAQMNRKRQLLKQNSTKWRFTRQKHN